MTKELKRVVITGMGAITPLGNTVDECWKHIVAGKSGVGMITKFDTTHFKTKFAAEPLTLRDLPVRQASPHAATAELRRELAQFP